MDDGCKAFEPVETRRWRHAGQRHRQRRTTLALSALLPLLVSGHWSPSRTFQPDYPEYVARPGRPSGPPWGRSPRVVDRLPRTRGPLGGSLSTRTGRGTGLACMASPPLAVWDTPRLATHHVLEGIAARGKTSMGWF